MWKEGIKPSCLYFWRAAATFRVAKTDWMRYRKYIVALPWIYGWATKFYCWQNQLDFLRWCAFLHFIDKKKVEEGGALAGTQWAARLRYYRICNILENKAGVAAPAGLETFTEAEAAMMMSATAPPQLLQNGMKQRCQLVQAKFFISSLPMPKCWYRNACVWKIVPVYPYTEAVSAGIKGMLQQWKKTLSRIKTACFPVWRKQMPDTK